MAARAKPTMHSPAEAAQHTARPANDKFPAAGRVRIGISGWTYAPWRGVFYPAGLPQKRELEYAARAFSSIEINGTFYSLQRPKYFAAWRAATPEGFVFSVKGPRFITHVRRLRDCATPLANFFASGLFALGPRLGPVLWQLPPNFRFDAEVVEQFCALLPHDTDAAQALAHRHDRRLSGRALLRAEAPAALHHVLEIRHESFVAPAFITLLRRHGVGLVCADTVAWPRLMDAPGDVVYCRLHGDAELYRSGYDDAALDGWAARVIAWARGGAPPDSTYAAPRRSPTGRRDVFVYFDNTDKQRAPRDAAALVARVQAALGPAQG